MVHVNSGVREGSPPRRSYEGCWCHVNSGVRRVHLHGVVTRDVVHVNSGSPGGFTSTA